MTPLTLVRILSNIAVVAVMTCFVLAQTVSASMQDWPWISLILGTALPAIAAQFLTSIMRPQDVPLAFDEQVLANERSAHAFAYWFTMAVFITMLGLVLTDRLAAGYAFYFLGVPLGMAPALYMVIIFLRGRAV